MANEKYSLKVIARNVQIIIDKRGHTVSSLRYRYNISNSRVYDVLNGRTKPSFAFLDEMMRALNVGIEELTIVDWRGLW